MNDAIELRRLGKDGYLSLLGKYALYGEKDPSKYCDVLREIRDKAEDWNSALRLEILTFPADDPDRWKSFTVTDMRARVFPDVRDGWVFIVTATEE